MAVTVITAQQISVLGIIPALAAATATDGDAVANSGREFFKVTNGSASSITVTVATPATVDGMAIADVSVAIAAGVTKDIGPFPPSIFSDASGRVTAVCSAVTSVTIGAFKV